MKASRKYFLILRKMVVDRSYATGTSFFKKDLLPAEVIVVPEQYPDVSSILTLRSCLPSTSILEWI